VTTFSGDLVVPCGQTVAGFTLPSPPVRYILRTLVITLTTPVNMTNAGASGQMFWALGAFNFMNLDNGSPRALFDTDTGDVMLYSGSQPIPAGSIFSISYGAAPGFNCAVDGFDPVHVHYEAVFTPVPEAVIMGGPNNSSFDARQQRRLINRRGDVVDWFQGRKCSCSPDGDPSRANNNCRICRGLGYFYKDSKKVRGLVGSISSQKMLLESGIALPGDMVFSETFMPREVFSDFDMVRLTLQKGQPYEGDIIERGPGITDDLTYNATQVIDVYQNDPVAGITRSYIENEDYTFTRGTQTIVWQASVRQPAPGSKYGVKYYAIFDWVVFAPPNDRFERGTPLGNRVLLRKKHVVLAARQT
jgi:hypothetical protein